jgi:hypothetical protein
MKDPEVLAIADADKVFCELLSKSSRMLASTE